MTEFSSNLTFDKQETVTLASRVSGGSATESEPLEHALRATSIVLLVAARSSAGGSLVLTAEESDDGESWSEIEAVGTLTRTGSASLTVTPTKEWLRVAWEGGNGWTLDIAATGHATIEAGNIPSGSSGGGVEVLGPFTITDADDLNGTTGVHLADIAAGTLIVGSYCVMRESFSAGDSVQLQIRFYKADLSDYDYASRFDIGTASNAIYAWALFMAKGYSGTPTDISMVYAVEAGQLRARTPNDTPAQGSADIYVVVNVPA